MGCLKLEILDQQYKRTEPKVSYRQKELTFDFCAGKERRLLVYAYCYNNPLKYIDPTGKSGEAVIDEENKTITVNVHMIFYGGAATKENAEKVKDGMQKMWNDADGKLTRKGVEYSVKYNVTYQIESERDASDMAKSNTNVQNNFVRLEDKGQSQFFSNAGYFSMSDGATTWSHEMGHNLGLNYHSDYVSGTTPNIMVPRNARDATTGEVVNPATRTVQQRDVQNTFRGAFWLDGRARIGSGRVANTIFDKNGGIKYEDKGIQRR